jgi:hypothetical protein
MINFNSRSASLFILVSIAWIYGAAALVQVILNFESHWWWFITSSLYMIFLNELFLHCTLGHVWYNIDPQRWFYKILIFLSSTSLTFGSVRGMLIMHETHHIYADQDDKDYLSLKKRWVTSGTLSPLMFVYQPYRLEIPNQRQFVEQKENQLSILVNDPWTKFCDNNTVLLTIVWWTSLYFLAPVILFNILLMGRLLMSVYVLINTVSGHSKLLVGYRNFETPDCSYNNLLLHYVFLGVFSTLLHNNHHGKDFSKSQSHRCHWWEFDAGYKIQKFFIKPLIEKR